MWNATTPKHSVDFVTGKPLYQEPKAGLGMFPKSCRLLLGYRCLITLSSHGGRLCTCRPTSLNRTFFVARTIFKEQSAYQERLAARKPLPVIPETDLEEYFIKGMFHEGEIYDKVLDPEGKKSTRRRIAFN